MAFDDLTDATDTAELSLFIKGVNAKLKVTEELASMNSLCETTGGKMFLELKNHSFGET